MLPFHESATIDTIQCPAGSQTSKKHMLGTSVSPAFWGGPDEQGEEAHSQGEDSPASKYVLPQPGWRQAGARPTKAQGTPHLTLRSWQATATYFCVMSISMSYKVVFSATWWVRTKRSPSEVWQGGQDLQRIPLTSS